MSIHKLDPASRTLLTEIMRQELAKTGAEIERLSGVRKALEEWLQMYGTPGSGSPHPTCVETTNVVDRDAGVQTYICGLDCPDGGRGRTGPPTAYELPDDDAAPI